MSAGTRARLSPGEQLRGEGRPLSVTGCLLFKEWDPEDRKYYFWEEWQLSGMDDYDTWVELDHYDGRVYLYEPLRFVEQLDPGSLHPGQILTLTSGTDVYAARVVELGAGVLHETVGATSCRLARGEEMGYAEVELTDAIAKKLGLKVEWKVLSFDSLLAGLQRDRWDLAISSHGITEERAKVVDFTNPHYCGGATIVSKDGKVAKAADLAGKTVAVQTGTTYLERLRKMDGIGAVRNFPLDRDARAATVSGRADAWVTDKFVAMEAIKLVPDSGLKQGEILFPERMAGAMSKGNTELVNAFNKGLAEVMADGTYEKLSKKYFDQDIRCKD